VFILSGIQEGVEGGFCYAGTGRSGFYGCKGKKKLKLTLILLFFQKIILE
jgi:hypothetical protein